ncbi:MAG TPA: hypothetical protein VEI04_07275, partial [Syntrophobacteria bacterium]|nr:hypothetical protein [Syntrophobacteria bacterium]
LLGTYGNIEEARRVYHGERRKRIIQGGYKYPEKYQLQISEATRGDFNASAQSAFTQLLDAAQIIQDKQRLVLGSEAEHRPVAGGQRVQTLAEILRAMYVGSPEKWSGMWNLAKPILAQRFGL